MYRYVLQILLVCCTGFGFIPCVVSADDYFDSNWWKKQREIQKNDFTIDLNDRLRKLAEKDPDSDRETTTLGFQIPRTLLKHVPESTDSIKVEENRVKRQKEIPGIRIERYHHIPLDRFMVLKFDENLDTIWEKKRKQYMKKWSNERRAGGLMDLDIAIPVGQRFEKLVGGKTNIKIDGTQRIEFSGKSEFDEGVIATSTTKNSKFPSLSMKQEPRFTIRGNVGDRVTIDIRQDSQAGPFSNLEENISIKYQGEDRDILKYIEAGNTSLNLKGATFAGYSGRHRGLFGIRAEAQLGPVEITTIASQEKGESSTKSFKGTAEEAVTQIKDYEYKSNTYFFIDHVFRDNFALARDSFDRIMYYSVDSLAVFEVYVNDNIEANDTSEGTYAYPGVAYPMSMYDRDLDNLDAYIEGFFHRMDPTDYYVNRELGFVQFRTRIPDEWTVGVYMVTQDDREFGSLEYDPSNPDSLKNVFKLIKPKGQRPTDVDTWNLEWKNVYNLGPGPIDLDGLEIKIFRRATDGVSRDKQNGISYIHILGLDKTDEQGNLTPDNKVDYNRGFVDRYRGELIFPLLRPFDPEDKPIGVDAELEEKVPQIYDVYNLKEKEEVTKYYIEVKTANRQASFRISSFGGVLENSEEVYLNGKKLAKGTDYRINYMSGEITFLNEDATSPNAELDIKYQERNAFQEMQKTLFGIRGEYTLNSDSRFGAVFLFNNESTKDKRVRLGNEPSRMMLFDADADINLEPQFLTRAVDMLPGVVGSAPSRVRIQTEIARSMPTLNTHGEVYIDDFEGSQNTTVSIMRTNWSTASVPDRGTALGMRIEKRGTLNWYNPWDRIDSEEIWPNKETTAGENTVHVLRLDYTMAEGVSENQSFAGIMNPFWGSGIDLSRARFIEVWARGGKGQLMIDIGSISEDFYNKENPSSYTGDGKLNTEDKPIPGQGHGDGILKENEDTGLDGLFNKQEPGYSKDNKDPSGDDWRYSGERKNDYTRINGTEGNARDSDRAGLPDTEDINGNGILDTKNIYYEYSVDLSDPTDPYLVQDSVPSGDSGGWRLFRIPLWNNRQAIDDGTKGSPPDSTRIEFSRLWITGTDKTKILIASIEVVESNWLEQGIFDGENEEVTESVDDVVRVSTKNTHENIDYKPPPGVLGELDRDTKIRKKEQSAVLEVENLDAGNTAFIYRDFEVMDLTDYNTFKMHVNGYGEGTGSTFFPEPGSGPSEYELIIRFGGDKKNYYEYRSPIYRGWAHDSKVDIDLARCTNLKLLDEFAADPKLLAQEAGERYHASWVDSLSAHMPDSVAVAVADTLVLSIMDALLVSIQDSLETALIDTVGNKIYTIEGNPSLNNVKIISIGFRNNSDYEITKTEVWIDELRLDELRDMEGTAYKVDINADLSGFINLTGKIERKSDDFHGMNAKKGSGQDNTKLSSSLKVNLDRFTPDRWKLKIPISGNLSESELLPRLKSGSDIVLPVHEKIQYRTFSQNKKARVSYSKGHDATKRGVTGFLTRWSLEKVSASFDWGEDYQISPSRGETTSDNQNLSFNYDVNPTEKGFVLLGWLPELPTGIGQAISNATFKYSPNMLNYSYTQRETNRESTDIDGNVEPKISNKTATEEYNFGYNPFKTINYDFTLSRGKDLMLAKKDKEVSYTEESKLTIQGPELFNITNKYNYNIKYEEENNPKYSLSSQLGSREVLFTKSFSATADFALDKFLEENISGKPRPPRKTRGTVENRPTWRSFFGWLKKDDRDAGSDQKDDEKESDAAAPDEKQEEKKPPRDDTTLNDKKEADPEEKAAEKKKAQKETEDDKKTAPKNQKGKDAASQEGKDEAGKKKGESIRTRLVMAVSNAVSPVNFDYRQNEQLNYSGISARPGIGERFGFRAIDPPDTSTVVSSRNSSRLVNTYSARTSVKLPLDIALRYTGKLDMEQRKTSSVDDDNERKTPLDLTLNWTNFENKIPFLKRFFTSMNLTSKFARSYDKTKHNGTLSANKKQSNYSPLISINTRIWKKFDTTFTLTNTLQENIDYSGDVESTTEIDTKTTKTKIRYRLDTSKGFPLFRKLKLRSDINLSLSYDTSKRTTFRMVGREQGATIADDVSNTISFDGNYNFSQKFRGGASFEFSSSKDITAKVHKIREISIWCELKF